MSRVDELLDATYLAEQEHFWFRGFRRFVVPAIERAASGRRDLRILDCGCGTGSNLALLAPYGRAFGFDLNALGLGFARRSGHARVARASIGAIPFPDAAFDLVTSFDVWQTLPPSVEAAAPREMFRVLRPRGAMVLNVAALSILFGNHSVLSEEQQRYDSGRLRRLVEGVGFRVERLTYTNFTLFPLMLAVRTMQRAVGLKPAEEARGEITVPPRPVNAVLSALLAAEAAVARRVDMPIGSSLLCVARKP
ncbi:MAG: class I SAM-dependent methyltransferase [Acidobacteria bacterium]|nr:MAG: class I SAM-dependent methyltransferase [Acidobacteriota bacterium]